MPIKDIVVRGIFPDYSNKETLEQTLPTEIHTYMNLTNTKAGLPRVARLMWHTMRDYERKHGEASPYQIWAEWQGQRFDWITIERHAKAELPLGSNQAEVLARCEAKALADQQSSLNRQEAYHARPTKHLGVYILLSDSELIDRLAAQEEVTVSELFRRALQGYYNLSLQPLPAKTTLFKKGEENIRYNPSIDRNTPPLPRGRPKKNRS